MIERRRFAAIRLQQQTDARVDSEIGADEFGGVIGGAVVYYENFKFRIKGSKRRADRIDDDRFLVIGRNHNGDVRLVFGMVRRVGPEFFCKRQQPDYKSSCADEQNPCDEYERDAGTEPAEGFKGEGIGASKQPLFVSERRHHLGARLAQQSCHRNEFETLGAQAVNNLRQRDEGVTAVSAPVMHQDDISLAGLGIGHHALDDGIHGRRRATLRFAPIMWIDLCADDDVTHGLRNGKHRNFAGRFGLVIDAERRPKKKSFHSQVTFQKKLGKIQFKLKRGFRNVFKIRVRERVVSHLISQVKFTLHDSGILIRGLAYNEKGRGSLLLAQDVDDLGRPFGIRTVVERERYFVRQVSNLIDAPGERIGLEGFIGEKIGGSVVLEITPAALRSISNAPDIALAFQN